MISCFKCGYENQAHYKRCINCGVSLTEQPPPLVESAVAQGRICYVSTYRDGKEPLRTKLIFHDPADAEECARVLGNARKPGNR